MSGHSAELVMRSCICMNGSENTEERLSKDLGCRYILNTAELSINNIARVGLIDGLAEKEGKSEVLFLRGRS